MAMRAAFLARSLSAQFSRSPRHIPIRAFSRSSIFYDAPQPAKTLAGDPPKKRGRPRKVKVEATDQASAKDDVVTQVEATDKTSAKDDVVTQVEATDKTGAKDDVVTQAAQIDNELAAHSATSSESGTEKPAESGSVELPPVSEWQNYFPSSYVNKTRASIMDPERAAELAEAFVPSGSRDKVIVEAFPGPGVLTRALLALPRRRLRKLIILEDDERYLSFLKPLEKEDDRVIVVPQSGFLWDTYEEISTRGLLDGIKKVQWSQEHAHLQFISHIPSKVHGEQLVSQFFRSIPDQQWFFKFGRIPFNLIMTESLWERIAAPLGGQARCKLSVIAEATSYFDYAIDPSKLKPYRQYFHPSNIHFPPEFVAISCLPLENQWIEKGLLDEWDYCLRRLFVQRAQPLKKCIPQLAPGAMSILTKIADESRPLEERVARRQAPRKMTPKEWQTLVRAFVEWPFKPDDLSIDNFHTSQTRQSTKLV